ncbi:MAG: threonine--tRNA ligase, partial [Alloprevotella tannerae]|nr:threonine--tRNA ligase [Alloprevotella tannerae]
DYAHKVKEQLETAGIRANIDERNEKVGRKIRDNEIKHIPYLLVVGEKEQADGSVNVRKQGEGTQETMTIPLFAEKVLKEVAELTEKY